jgi:putative oxidoreductase
MNDGVNAALILLRVTVGVTMILHGCNGFFIFRPGEGYEYVLNLAVAGAALGGLGPGAWSIDHALGHDEPALVGLGVAVGAGVGGAVLLLALCWRPNRVADPT